MKQRWGRICPFCILVFWFCVLCICASCKAEPKKTVDVFYEVKEHGTLLKQNESAWDIVPAENGFLLLKRNAEGETYIARLDNELCVTNECVRALAAETVSLMMDGTTEYAYQKTGTNAYGMPIYDLCRNGEVYQSLSNAGFDDMIAHMTVFEHTLFAAVPSAYEGRGNVFIIGGHVIDVPENSADGDRNSVCGFVSINNRILAIIGRDKISVTGENELYTRIEKRSAVFLPVSPDSTGLPDDGIEFELPESLSLCASDGRFGYLLAGTKLYRTDGDSFQGIYDLAVAGLEDGNTIRRMLALKDGRILFLFREGLWECIPSVGQGEKEVYTVGVCRVNDSLSLTKTISHFNRTNDQYAFVLREFPSAEALNLALLSGEVSIVVSADQTLLEGYAKKEMLWDLEELLPELRTDGVLLPQIVDALRVEGICRYLPRCFTVYALKADREMLGEKEEFEGWRDFLQFAKKQDPAFFKGWLRSNWFHWTAVAGYDDWIDWNERTAHFTDQSFIDLLASCMYCAADFDALSASGGQDTHMELSAINGRLSPMFDSDDVDQLVVGLPVKRIVPLPNEKQQKHCAGAPFFMAAVQSGTDADVQRVFLRYIFLSSLLEDDFVNSTGFSIRNDEFEAQMEGRDWDLSREREEPDKSDEIVNQLKKEGVEDKTRAIVNATDHFCRAYRDDIADILIDESTRFFRGEITAEKAAEYIQNRVSIYLAEQG